jgi:hypothetical protein
MARGKRSNASDVLLSWLYRGFADAIPQNLKHRKRDARNEEVRVKAANGRDAASLATDYGDSAKRIYQIISQQQK